jgi:CBS domain-containing protein
MDTVRSILGVKGSEIVSVGPDAALSEVLEVMAERNVGAVLVIDAAGQVVGVFSERDLARRLAGGGRSVVGAKVRELMTPNVLYVSPDTSIQDCMALMTDKRIRHLPVLANGRLLGLVSIGDVVKALIKVQEVVISEQAAEIGMLNSYITGSP